MATTHTRRHRSLILCSLMLSLSVAACSPFGAAPSTSEQGAAETDTTNEQASNRPAGWDEASHSNSVDPNYDVVFPVDKVNQMTITISSQQWEAMQADLTEILGEPGSRGGPGGRGDFPPPGADQLPPGDPPQGEPPAGGPPAGGFGGPGRGMTIPNPMWVEGTISFNGQTWNNVGVRYKGNSSLSGSWNSQSGKLPFKLDFDQFEDQHPEINDQRFYGFKQLSLSNNWNDPTMMRETVVYDLLDEAGLVAANTAFYEVLVDHGEGSESLGVYTMIEVVDDTVVQHAFDDDSGNIYEADGEAASLTAGVEDQIEASFQKENNETEADWGDIKALYAVLHSDTRTSDPAAWRSDLEAVFDVDAFLEWLGLSAIIQHWDTYGGMTHNFYLYDDPTTGKLTWISWDHNLVLGASAGPGGGRFPGGQPGQGGQGDQAAQPDQARPAGGGRGFAGRMSTSLDKADVGDEWPLIRYVLDDPTYYAKYISLMKETSSKVFDPQALTAKYQQLSKILAPYAEKESSAEAFTTAVEELTTKTNERAKAAEEFLAKQ